jgi:hypothetical protein
VFIRLFGTTKKSCLDTVAFRAPGAFHFSKATKPGCNSAFDPVSLIWESIYLTPCSIHYVAQLLRDMCIC